MRNKTADLMITDGLVVTCNPAGEVFESGTVVVDQGKITAVGDEALLDTWQAGQTLSAAGCIVMPGLVNAHTHLPMSLFRGVADDLPLMTWLQDHIFPAEAAHVNPETVRIGALLSCAELLLSGTTTCCDGYFYEDVVAEAIFEIGMRAIVGQGVIDYPAPGVPDPTQNIKAALAFVEKWKDRSSRINPSIFCHSPYTCSSETLSRASREAFDREILFQIHVAETQAEQKQSLQEKGLSPVAYLDQLDILRPGTLLVHAVWVDEADRRLLARKKVGIVHNPESNMKMGAGVAPVPDLVQDGIAVGLGTDGCASNNNLDLFEEMDTAAKLHKVSRLDSTVMPAEAVLLMATRKGAEAIGLGHAIGSLAVGKQADIIVVDTRKPHLVPLYNPVSHLVYAAKGADVRDVLVDGTILVQDGRLLPIDLNLLLEKAARVGRKIKQLPTG